MVKKIQRINKQEAKEIGKITSIPIYRTQKGKSNRGSFYIPDTVMFKDLNSDILNLQELIKAYDLIKGNEETKIINEKLNKSLKYKKSLLK